LTEVNNLSLKGIHEGKIHEAIALSAKEQKYKKGKYMRTLGVQDWARHMSDDDEEKKKRRLGD
jgi:hypothetical protein